MNKTAAIFHGTGGSENSFWIPWLKNQLEQNGFDVWTPSLPADENGKANLDVWLEESKKRAPHKQFDLMVAHSAGVAHMMRLLSNGFQSKNVIGVAGFMKPIPTTPTGSPSYPTGFDVATIIEAGKNFTFIHSDNDPWGCDVAQGQFMRETFSGTLVVQTGEGHFGSDSLDQPYTKFPLLLAHCLLEEK